MTAKSDATYHKGRMWGANHQFKVGTVVENASATSARPSAGRISSLLVSRIVDRRWAGTGGTGDHHHLLGAVAAAQRAIGNTWGIYGEDILRPISNSPGSAPRLRIEQESITASGFIPPDPQGDSDKIPAETEGQSPATRLSTMYATFVAYEDRLGALSRRRGPVARLRLGSGGFYIQQSPRQRYRQPENINLHNLNFSPAFRSGGIRGTTARPSSRCPRDGSTTRSSSAS